MAGTGSESFHCYIEALADELEISEAQYERVTESYMELGRWFSRDGSPIAAYDPVVYAQGSFSLGTGIKRPNREEYYDIDVVCELRGARTSELSQEQLKSMVGTEMEAYQRSKSLVTPLRERRHSWTLSSKEGAHLRINVVPALAKSREACEALKTRGFDARLASTAIAITDNQRYDYRRISDDWPWSNPTAYLEWFKSRIQVVLDERKRHLSNSLNASVEQIPDYQLRTPLQAAIMILKRHRDVMFKADGVNDYSMSIIITTLAAHAYNGQEDTVEALQSILTNMERYIECDSHNRAILRNPGDPMENFADRWAEFPEQERSFYIWLREAREDFDFVASLDSHSLITETLSCHIGVELAKTAERRIQDGSGLASLEDTMRLCSVRSETALNSPRH